jgi:hypothetical protein
MQQRVGTSTNGAKVPHKSLTSIICEVANLVARATSGTEPSVVIAALLHDAIEDQNVSAETIANEFGKRVADIVLEVSDDKSLLKAERKRLQVDHAPQKSREAKLIKLADKTSNLRAVANSPAPDWSVERRLGYFEWARGLLQGYGVRRVGWNSSSMKLLTWRCDLSVWPTSGPIRDAL